MRGLVGIGEMARRLHPVTSPVPAERLAAGRRVPLGIKMGLNRGTKRILPYV